MTKFSELHNMVRESRVNTFLVWRVGQAVAWDCTQEEIARETGLCVRTVNSICKARGWTTRGYVDAGMHMAPVDSVIGSTHPRYRRAWL